MARPLAKMSNEPEFTETGISEQVTYLPGEEDPPQVKWMGIVFHANIPKAVSHAGLIERAKGNKFFHVGAFDPSIHAVKTREEVPSPKTPEQYRAHAVAWLKTMQSVDELDLKWAAEETLRMSCEVGTDDLDYLGSLFQPKRGELRKREMPQRN